MFKLKGLYKTSNFPNFPEDKNHGILLIMKNLCLYPRPTESKSWGKGLGSCGFNKHEHQGLNLLLGKFREH